MQKRVRKALHAIEKGQSKTLKAQQSKNRKRVRSKIACQIKKQENGHNAADGAQSTETTPKTPKFSDKSRKDRLNNNKCHSPESKLDISQA